MELGLTGGKPVVTHSASAWPIAGDKEAAWMDKVVRSGKWSWLGEHERAFSEEFRKFIGTKYSLCLSNGTVTLQCALQAIGVEPGDEVIVPGMTWVATVQAAMDIGANVVLVDVDPETLCIDPKATESAITPKTKVIIPVHLYGCMCDMDAIMAISEKHNIKVLEDTAHQAGSQWRGKGAGSIGHAGSFSFQQTKILTCGEGGAITCNDHEVYETAFALKQVGWRPADVQNNPFDNLVEGNHYGHNSRLTEMQAVLLRGGLSRLEDQNNQRAENVAYLSGELEKIGGPLRAAKRDSRVTRQVYYAMTCHFDPDNASGATRDMYLAALRAENAGFDTGYPPVYKNKLLNLYDRTSPIPYRDPAAVQDYKNLNLPNTERACYETGVLLGQSQLLGERAYIDQTLEAVKKVNDNLPAVVEHFQACYTV
jgi:L-glutamine:2-deoxy-scyllo-inosose/3-amino-2,3-dideoxy-scyllo-inosose aminotransferase